MNVLRSIALAAVAACSVGSAHAFYIVDTGSVPDSHWGYALYEDQSLGATFNVAAATTINSVEGWMWSTKPGTVTVQLIDGNDANGDVLFSGNFAATAGPATWWGADNLEWVVAAGDYTVAFHADPGFFGAMPSAAPNPLVTEWVNDGGQTTWYQADDLDLGVRIAAVPEPSSYVLMLLGLAGVGTLLRRRT